MQRFTVYLFSLSFLLLVSNLSVLYFYGESSTRWFGVFSTGVFFLFFLWRTNYSWKMLVFFISYLLGDFFLIFFEDPLLKKIAFILRIISFLSLIYVVVGRLKNLKFRLLEASIFFIAIIINIYLLIELVNILPDDAPLTAFDYLFYAYGISVILCTVAAISYHNRYASKASFYFVSAVINLVFSKLCYYAGIYLGFEEFYFAFVFFEIMGISFVLKYVEKKPEESVPLV